MTTKTNFVVSLVLLLVGVPIFSQVRKPAFEVATVKPAIDDALPLIQVQRGGRFVSRNVPLKQVSKSHQKIDARFLWPHTRTTERC